MKLDKVSGTVVVVGLAAAAYWLLSPADPNAMCSDNSVRTEVQNLVGSLTPVGKALDAMLEPGWKPEQPPQPAGSNGYIAVAPDEIKKPSPAELSGLRSAYVQLVSPSLAVAYDRDLERVTCQLSFQLNNQAIIDAASRSDAYKQVSRLANMAVSVTELKAIFKQGSQQNATYTVQPGDQWGTYTILVQPL
jgi:hypothetical protein